MDVGSHALRPLYPSKFWDWVRRSGYPDEFTFWSSLSGIQASTIVDHMNHYLGSLGYTGTPWDKRKQFLIDQTTGGGTIFDVANKFFDGTFSVSSGDSVRDDDGNVVLDDDGNVVTN